MSLKRWYNNGAEEKCLLEGEQPDGFVLGRLKKVKKVDIYSEKISKQDLFKYYTIDNHSFIDTVEHFDISPNGILNLLLKKYNIHKDPKVASKNNHFKRSYEDYLRCGEKSRLILKERFCRSLAEQKAYDKLIERYGSTQYDVKIDGGYNYYVDFYIPDIDLYIELLAHPSHGNLPYDENNEKAVENSYLLFGQWLDVYTKLDPRKYQEAKQNGINLIRIYPRSSIEDNYKFNDNKFIDVIDIVYNSQKKT